MIHLALIALLPIAFAVPAAAQPMDHSSMPGMNMPGPKAKPAPSAKAAKPASPKSVPVADPHAGHDMSKMPSMAPSAAPAADPHAGHDMSKMPGVTPAGPATADPHAGHDMSAMPGMPKTATAGTDAPGRDMAAMDPPPVAESPSPPPPVPTDHAAERYYDPVAMADARRQLRREHGGETYSMVMANLAEYQARKGGDGYRWEGEAWFGGDLNRFVVKTEGEGDRRGGVSAGEVQGLYSRTIGPYFNLQAGVRQDFQPHPSRTFATVGVEGLAPYWFDVQGALFLSNKGELLARAEVTYDLRLSQRLILQPRVELNLAAQNTPRIQSGSGLSDAELGLRLRYEITREFAPYVGVSYERRFGKTADYRRLAGEGASDTSLVFGIRSFF